MPTDVVVRPARDDDYDDVASFTGPDTTWPDRDVGDYLPDVFSEWVERAGPDQRTLVAERGGSVVGLVQGSMLTDREGWAQGIRVAPEARGSGVGTALTEAVLDWARERGAEAVRNLVFGWNGAGMRQSRAAGFVPCSALRWAFLDPETRDPALPVANDPGGAWQYWRTSDAREVLGGLGFDFDRAWTLAELTRERLARAAAETRVFAVERGGRTRAVSYRTRTFERGDEQWAEYGAAAWADEESASALLAAIASDGAELGVDRLRVAVPETARHASGAAGAGGALDDGASFVFEVEL